MTDTEQNRIDRTKRIIEKCGGIDAVAEVTERSKIRVYAWTYLTCKNGTGGIIPAKCQIKILEYSRRKNLGIEPSDFFPEYPQGSAA